MISKRSGERDCHLLFNFKEQRKIILAVGFALNQKADKVLQRQTNSSFLKK
jgi:hypothetical protein